MISALLSVQPRADADGPDPAADVDVGWGVDGSDGTVAFVIKR
jgi:hypothetical protein